MELEPRYAWREGTSPHITILCSWDTLNRMFLQISYCLDKTDTKMGQFYQCLMVIPKCLKSRIQSSLVWNRVDRTAGYALKSLLLFFLGT